VNTQDLAKGVEHAKHIIGDDYEISLIKDRVKPSKKLWDEKIIITTLGEKGAEISEFGKIHKIEAVKHLSFVDPTGAGDAFRAGFLAGLSKQFDLPTCGRMGAVAASFAIEEYGTQEHVFTKEEFSDRYRQTYGVMLSSI
jgi:adenosine kinase